MAETDFGSVADIYQKINWRPMTDDDMVGFAGATDFSSGDRPKIGEFKLVMPDGKTIGAFAVFSAGGVEVYPDEIDAYYTKHTEDETEAMNAAKLISSTTKLQDLVASGFEEQSLSQ